MIKCLFVIILCLSSVGAFAREGFKVGTDGTKFFTWYGGVALYQDAKDNISCKLDKVTKAVDYEGNAFRATGFSCRKDLFIVVKEYLDNKDVLFIVLDPAKFKERKVYRADLFLEYNKEDK